MSQISMIENLTQGWNVSDIRIANLSDSMNMYCETQGSGASTTAMLRSIYGTSVVLKIGTKRCRGLFEASRSINGTPLLFGVYGNELHVIYLEEGEWKNELIYDQINNENVERPVSMCETGGEGSAHPHLIIVDGSNVIAVDTTLTYEEMKKDIRTIQLPYRVVQEDPDNPSQRIVPTHCAYCYNYLIVNDCGTDAFYTTYQYPFERQQLDSSGSVIGQIDYDIFMVDSQRSTEIGYKNYGFVTYAEWSPDNLTALRSNGTYIYTFGPKSTQIFTYNSDVDAPFVSPTNCANGIGIKAEYSLAAVADYMFYLGSSSIGENGIYQWQGNALSKISTPEIERKIAGLTSPEDAVGQCWLEDGHLFYALTFIAGDYTLVYDITEGLWHRRSTKDATTNAHHYWRPQFATLHNSELMFGTHDGYLVRINRNKFDEYDGRPMIRQRRSGMILNNYQEFIVDHVKLVCNNGDINDIDINPQVMMRYCDNGGEWSNQEICLMGKQGQYSYETEWFNLGLHRIMCIEISVSDAVNFAILGGTIQYDLLDSL